jgi:trk system potassium uptake protein TrkA
MPHRSEGVKKILVIGLGRLGTALVETLWSQGIEVVAIDPLPEAVDALKDRTTHAFVGDATDPKVLEGIGAADVDGAVVTFGNRFEASVLCVATLHRMGLANVVARAETPRQADILVTIGASRVMQIETEMGRRLGHDLVHPMAADLLNLASDYRVIPWTAEGAIVGQTLAQAGLRRRYGLTVLGYRSARPDVPPTEGRPRLTMPSPDQLIQEGDTLLLVGEQDGVTRFFSDLAD